MTRPIPGRAYCFSSDALAWFVCVHVAPDGYGTLIDSTTLEPVSFGAGAPLVEVGEGEQRDAAIAKVVAWLWRTRDARKQGKAA